ncbi:MAG: hypothetical protein IJD02_00930 [Lachnospiraceae bacterium]|nr:hypothetical protein [Lachnospiraceae bacterium]
MDSFDKIMFISMDDTSTGPMAEAICKNLVPEEWDVCSRGLVVHFSEPVNPKAIDILNNNYVKLTKECSVPFDREELTQNTLILAMSAKEKKLMVQEFEVDEDKVFILSEFVEEFGEVPDPYGESIVGYEMSYIELIRMIKKLVYKLG